MSDVPTTTEVRRERAAPVNSPADAPGFFVDNLAVTIGDRSGIIKLAFYETVPSLGEKPARKFNVNLTMSQDTARKVAMRLQNFVDKIDNAFEESEDDEDASGD